MKNSIKNSIIIIAFLAIMIQFGSCKVTTDYTQPEQETPLTYSQDFVKDSTIADLAWWKLFKDPVLIDLINTALAQNQSLQIAIARIEESRLYLDISKADLYPNINYGTGTSSSINSESSDFSNSINSGVNVSYTVDLWQKVKTMNEVSLQEYLATEEAYKSVYIQIIASMANAYISLRDLDNRLSISEKTANNYKENLGVMSARFDAGFVSEVDLSQAEIQLIDANAAIESFNRLRKQLENGISILMGSAPQEIPRGLSLNEQISLPEVPVGLPSGLLNRRPDILEAQRKLNAQSLRIGVAETLQYPSLTLSVNMGAQLLNPAALFADMGAQLVGPLFNGGKIKKGIEVEKNRTEQLLYSYQFTFLNSLKEVEDAMISQTTYKKEYELRNKQMELATKAAYLSWVRYDGGLTSYLEVLALQTSQFSAELQASSALQQELASIVNLYEALGGGWYTSAGNE